MALTRAEVAKESLDEAFKEGVKQRFLGIVAQIDADGAANVAVEIEHFRRGLRHLLAAYEGASQVIDEELSVIS